MLDAFILENVHQHNSSTIYTFFIRRLEPTFPGKRAYLRVKSSRAANLLNFSPGGNCINGPRNWFKTLSGRKEVPSSINEFFLRIFMEITPISPALIPLVFDAPSNRRNRRPKWKHGCSRLSSCSNVRSCGSESMNNIQSSTNHFFICLGCSCVSPYFQPRCDAWIVFPVCNTVIGSIRQTGSREGEKSRYDSLLAFISREQSSRAWPSLN